MILKVENKTYKILGEFVKSGNHERKREDKYYAHGKAP